MGVKEVLDPIGGGKYAKPGTEQAIENIDQDTTIAEFIDGEYLGGAGRVPIGANNC